MLLTPTVELAARFVLVALIIGFRFYLIYRQAKAAPKRSPRVRRIELIFAISLWSFVAVAVIFLLLWRH